MLIQVQIYQIYGEMNASFLGDHQRFIHPRFHSVIFTKF